jgi:tryptophan 2,3-dioxygenase
MFSLFQRKITILSSKIDETMDNSPLDPELLKKLRELKDKYESTGQDIHSYLEGLKHADYLRYWDYIHLDTLLTLQTPKTGMPDEVIFILYHQITELYFKLIIHELRQVCYSEKLDAENFIMRIQRVVRYFKHLESSFGIMSQGMEKDQFLKFRMALLPSSGFQSAQFRKIEICMTDLINLVDPTRRDEMGDRDSVEDLFTEIYWKKGATELATGNKTLTLRHFEEKYESELTDLAREMDSKNVWKQYVNL